MEGREKSIESAKETEAPSQERLKSIGKGALESSRVLKLSEVTSDEALDKLLSDMPNASDTEVAYAWMEKMKDSVLAKIHDRRVSGKAEKAEVAEKTEESAAEVEAEVEESAETNIGDLYPRYDGESDDDYRARTIKLSRFGELMSKTPRNSGESEEDYQARIMSELDSDQKAESKEETSSDKSWFELYADKNSEMLKEGLFDLKVSAKLDADGGIESGSTQPEEGKEIVTADNLVNIEVDDADLRERLSRNGLADDDASVAQVREIISRWNQSNEEQRKAIYNIDGKSFDAGDDNSWTAGILRSLDLVA